MTNEACHEPPNGGGRCIKQDVLEALEHGQAQERKAREAGEGRIIEAIGILTGEVSTLAKCVGQPPNPNDGFNGTGLQRTIWLMRTEPRPAMHSLDYGEGENTEVQDRPIIVGRMKVAERMNVSLEAQVAELRGQLKERDRQSERARTDASAAATRAADAAKAADESALKTNELAIAKWKVTAGLIVGALMAIAAIGQAIASAFGG